MMVKSPKPKLSNKNIVTRKLFSNDLKIIERIQVIKITEQVIISVIQKTGLSSNRSRTVPPPTAVTNAMMSTPNGSRRFCIAAKLPDIANAMVPRTSIMKFNC